MNEKPDINRISALLADESFQNYILQRDAEDIEYWEKAIRKHPELAEQVAEAKQVLACMTFNKEAFSETFLDEEWEHVLDRASKEKHASRKMSIRLIYKSWQKIAALILLPLLIGVFVVQMMQGKLADQQYTTIANEGTQRNQVILPDSTLVYLNGGSTIRYPASYNRRNRTIEIVGEAYFDVVHNKRKPFNVLFADARVTVLGTEFSIRNYGNEPYSQVVLVEGKVAVNRGQGGQTTILMPGQKALLNHDDNLIQISRASLDVETAWINNVLVIEGDAFDTLLLKLENWYGVKIEARNIEHAENSRFKLKLKTESLKEVLDLINLILPVDYEINGEEVVLSVKE